MYLFLSENANPGCTIKCIAGDDTRRAVQPSQFCLSPNRAGNSPFCGTSPRSERLPEPGSFGRSHPCQFDWYWTKRVPKAGHIFYIRLRKWSNQKETTTRASERWRKWRGRRSTRWRSCQLQSSNRRRITHPCWDRTTSEPRVRTQAVLTSTYARVRSSQENLRLVQKDQGPRFFWSRFQLLRCLKGKVKLPWQREAAVMPKP